MSPCPSPLRAGVLGTRRSGEPGPPALTGSHVLLQSLPGTQGGPPSTRLTFSQPSDPKEKAVLAGRSFRQDPLPQMGQHGLPPYCPAELLSQAADLGAAWRLPRACRMALVLLIRESPLPEAAVGLRQASPQPLPSSHRLVLLYKPDPKSWQCAPWVLWAGGRDVGTEMGSSAVAALSSRRHPPSLR